MRKTEKRAQIKSLSKLKITRGSENIFLKIWFTFGFCRFINKSWIIVSKSFGILTGGSSSVLNYDKVMKSRACATEQKNIKKSHSPANHIKPTFTESNDTFDNQAYGTIFIIHAYKRRCRTKKFWDSSSIVGVSTTHYFYPTDKFFLLCGAVQNIVIICRQYHFKWCIITSS